MACGCPSTAVCGGRPVTVVSRRPHPLHLLYQEVLTERACVWRLSHARRQARASMFFSAQCNSPLLEGEGLGGQQKEKSEAVYVWNNGEENAGL